MSSVSFATVTRRLHRQNIATFGSLVLALGMAGLLALGAQHAVEQVRARLTADFTRRMEYLLEQEQFLQQLHDQNARQQQLPDLPSGDARHRFDFVPGTGGAPVRPAHAAVGAYLDRQYAAFWAFSYFPAAPLLVLDGGDGSALLVPDRQTGAAQAAAPPWLHAARDIALREAPRLPVAARAGQAHALTPMRWFALPGEPGKMLGLAHAGFRRGRVPSLTDDASRVYMATVFSSARLLTGGEDDAPPEHRFWLQRDGRPLLGDGPPPSASREGFSLARQGLVLTLHDRSGTWTGRYRVAYGSFVAANAWLLAAALALLALATLGSVGYVRWYRVRVLEPARRAQDAIVESEAFNRTLIQTAPVALCLLDRDQGEVAFATALARDWLGLQPPAPWPVPPTAVWQAVRQATRPGVIEQIDLDGGRSLQLAYAPTRYQGRDVLLCAFTDITAHAEEQRALARARAAADEASAAKSTFLATMSHEIRTPLYGLLGTLELLALTRLDGQQAQHVARLQDASQQLLQQISDILDISKIEAGQMRVEVAPFDPRALVQQCTAGYAAMARRKGLLLFCTVALDVPDTVAGDALRIRQILSNLISNALKFTSAGHVIVRLQWRPDSDGRCRLCLEVADSGSGIPADKLEQVFAPFNAVHHKPHTVRGSGLGLSICQRLSRLMDGTLEVASEVGLGSRFTLQLPLSEAAAAAPREAPPQLDGLRLALRTPHPELSRHLAAWFERWGAAVDVLAVATSLPAADGRLLVDVQMPPSTAAWHGVHLRLNPPQGEASHPEIDGGSVDSIARGLLRLQQPQAPAEPPAAAPLPALGLDVLVAEDNPINQATLHDQLQQLGCRVTLAGDGAQALAQWNACACDVVLTDINMPRMNGYELARALRAQGAGCAIIGVTANAMRDEEQRCLDSGMDAWLVKPISLERLQQLLHRWAPPADAPRPNGGTPVAPAAPEADTGQAPIPERYRQVFRTTMRVDIDRCREDIAAGDADRVRQKLHRMRGALATVGQTAMAQALEAAEQRLLHEGWNAELGAELLALCQALDNLVAGT
ncbi:hybrid sensor histidine kinase/response regulator [Stenotrophomonas mori]|uniref:histidine kinase n=1 Tax=Stenotrophomonas mori TaxID=2871096 RepID=A0ABT0SJP4_9GAMM|nr:hybrid sensor histidine kinase/response regulator [Stenotrophomonas mori]MCL7715560.1 response regulator [Stenotrophomonas mori]